MELVREDPPGATGAPSELLESPAVSPPPFAAGDDPDAPAGGLAGRLYASLGGAADAEPTGERRLPWPIDILLYPCSLGGLTTLVIIVGIPLLLSLLPLGLAGWVIGMVIGLYSMWYLAECVYDSAKGGTRAPMALDTADLGEMWSRVSYLLAVYIIYVFPVVFYRMVFGAVDVIFWALTVWAILFFPMGLLAMVMNDSVSALNPLFLLGAILRTFFPYVGLIILFLPLAGLFWLSGRTPEDAEPSLLLDAVGLVVTSYVPFILAHLLGRFYWRNRERLDWGI